MAKTAGKERNCRLVTESNVRCGPASCAAKVFTNEAFRRREWVFARRRAGSCEKIQNRPRSGGRGSRRASWGKDLLRRRLARRLALPIFLHLPSVRGDPDFQQKFWPSRIGGHLHPG